MFARQSSTANRRISLCEAKPFQHCARRKNCAAQSWSSALRRKRGLATRTFQRLPGPTVRLPGLDGCSNGVMERRSDELMDFWISGLMDWWMAASNIEHPTPREDPRAKIRAKSNGPKVEVTGVKSQIPKSNPQTNPKRKNA